MSSETSSRGRAGTSPPLARHAPSLLLGIVLVAAPLMLGGLYPWAEIPICAGALLALATAAMFYQPQQLPAQPVVWAGLLGLGWTLLQTLPVPCALAALLNGPAVEHQARARELLELPPATLCVLSVDPGATREELLKGIAIVAVLVTALLTARHASRRAVLWQVAIASSVLGVVSALHAALGLERVYGVYAPVDVHGFHFVAPIVNPNTLGGVMVLGVPLLLGLGIGAEQRWLRALAIGGSALLVGVALMTRSRGAAGALILAVALYGYLELRRMQRRSKRNGRPRGGLQRYGAVVAAVAAIILVVAGSVGPLLEEFARGGLDKLELIQRAARAAVDAPLLGVGRGAFAAAFVDASRTTARFEHAESFPVQWAVEWGIPVALTMCLIFAWALWGAFRSSGSSARAGALAGLLALVAHNLLDLGFELLSVAVLASATLGAVLISKRPQTRQRVRPRPGLPRVLLGASIAGGLLLVALGPRVAAEHRPYLESALRSAVEVGDHDAVARMLQPALLAHPAEPSIVLYAAADAVQRDDPRTGRWLNRAMQLAPTWSAPHELAVHWLWRAGRTDQALLELREALSREAHRTASLLCSVLRQRRDAVDRILPRNQRRATVMARSAECLGFDSPEGRRIDAMLREEYPSMPRPRLRQARRLSRAGKHDEAWAELAPVLRDHRGSAEVLLAALEVLAAAGRDTEMLELLPAAIVAGADARRARTLEARARTRNGDLPGTRAALDRLRALSSTPERRVSTLRLEAELLPPLGDAGRALEAIREAYDISNDIKDLRTLARLAGENGQTHRERWARRELCRRARPGSADCAPSAGVAPRR